MANNNVPPTSSTPLPYSVPRIVMMATYTQSTQTPITLATNNSMQTDTSTFNTSATQTRPFQNNQATQTFPQQNTQAIQTDLGLNENLTLDSTDSSTSTDVLDETMSINNSNSNRKRKSNKEHLSNKRSHTKQRKEVTFPQDQQNSSELSDNNISTSEIRPILETYEQQLQTFQSSQTFETLTTDCNQPLAQSASYHNERQPMSTQQKAAMAQAALINFFGESGTVTSIMNTVHPPHTQTLTELSNQPELNISEHQQGRSLPVSTHSYTIPHITHSRQAVTDNTTQQNSNRQSYRVPHYYTDSHSYSDRRRVRRQNTHNHHRARKHSRKDDRK